MTLFDWLHGWQRSVLKSILPSREAPIRERRGWRVFYSAVTLHVASTHAQRRQPASTPCAVPVRTSVEDRVEGIMRIHCGAEGRERGSCWTR